MTPSASNFTGFQNHVKILFFRCGSGILRCDDHSPPAAGEPGPRTLLSPQVCNFPYKADCLANTRQRAWPRSNLLPGPVLGCGQAEEQTLGIEGRHERLVRRYCYVDLVLPSAFFSSLVFTFLRAVASLKTSSLFLCHLHDEVMLNVLRCRLTY